MEAIDLLRSQLREEHLENRERLALIEKRLPREGHTFWDGCHRWNWLISPILSAILSFAMFAYYMGGINMNIENMKKEIDVLKSEVFELAHITRGLAQ